MASAGVRVVADLPAVSRAGAEEFVRKATEAISQRGQFTVALSGGRTPRELYRLLASEYADQVDWSQVCIFFSDERYAPPDDPLTSYRMARETFLEALPIPAGQIYPMVTPDMGDPAAAASTYEQVLRTCFGPGTPTLDLILLGMGADGHTASLFPGTLTAWERERLVVGVEAPATPPLRISMTLPVLTAARQTLFLAAGAEKYPVWQELRADLAGAARRYPAAAVALEARQPAWLIDQAMESGV